MEFNTSEELPITISADKQFSLAEVKLLMDLHTRIVSFGGPLDSGHFRKIISVLNMTHLWSSFPNNLFTICDADKDGVINEGEWIGFLSLILRSNIEELGNVAKPPPKAVPFTPFLTPYFAPRLFLPTTESLQASSPAKEKPQKKSESFRNYASTLKRCYFTQNHLNLSLVSKSGGCPLAGFGSSSSEDVSNLKKAAIVKIHQVLPQGGESNTQFQNRLWGVVAKEPRLLKAWATSSVSTKTLISMTKAVMDVQARGKLRQEEEMIIGGRGEDWDLWEKHGRLRNIYGKSVKPNGVFIRS